MKKIILFYLLITIFAIGMKAQSLTVADGTARDRFIPVYGYYMDVVQQSQTLYPASMLTSLVGSYITELTYYFETMPNGSIVTNSWGGIQNIRIGVSTAADLTQGFDTIPVSNVWIGTLSDNIANSQMHITLDHPYLYNGGNLLIEFENPMGANFSDAYFYGQNQSTQLSYMSYVSNDSTLVSHGANFLPKLTIAYDTTGCFPPYNLHVEADHYSAILSWSPSSSDSASAYTIGYRTVTDTFSYMEVTDTFFVLNGLLPNVTYYWRVRANCGGQNTSAWKDASFTTPQIIGQLPYFCGFEDTIENLQWTILNDEYRNVWRFGNAVHQDGNNALYISDNNGLTHHYLVNSNNSSTAWAYRDVYLDTIYTKYDLSFDFLGMGQHNSDYMKVYVGPPATPRLLLSPANSELLGTFSLVEKWQHYHFVLDSTHVGLQRIYFLWTNNPSAGMNPPAAIDNLSVTGLVMPAPLGLSVSDVTTTEATLSWHSEGTPLPTTYTVSYRQYSDTNSTEIIVEDTVCRITGLEISRVYAWKVRANGQGNSSVWSGEILLQTLPVVASVPYNCGFEDTVENNQWRFVNGTNPNRWCIGRAVNHGGGHAMYISDDNGYSYSYTLASSAFLWAYRDIDFDTIYAGHRVSFDCKNYSYYNSYYYGHFKVFIGPPSLPSGSSAPEGAVQLGNDINGQNPWIRPTFLLDSTYRGVKRLYFYWQNSAPSGTNPPAAVDNVKVESFNCAMPENLTTVQIDTGSAILTWHSPIIGTATSYTVAYKLMGDSLFSEVTTMDTFYHFQNLETSTEYVWKVRAHCSSSDESCWSEEKTFITASQFVQLPYYCGFEDSLENRQWRIVNTVDEGWYIGGATSAEGDFSLYISNDGGVSNAVNPYSASTGQKFYAYRDVYFTPGYAEYNVSFDYKGDYDSYGHFRWFISMADAAAPTTSMSEPPGTLYQVYNNSRTDSVWTHYSYTLDSTFQGFKRICFSYSNPINSVQMPAAIDNIAIIGNNCPNVMNMRTLSVMDTAVLLAWSTDSTLFPSGYAVAFRPSGQAAFTMYNTTDTVLLLQGLNPVTTYEWKVRTICGQDDTSFWSPTASFATLQPIAQLPYYCDFEDGVENARWALVGSGINKWYIGGAVSNGGDTAMYISKDGGQTNTFSNTSGSNTRAYRDIYFNPDFKEYCLEFDARCAGGILSGGSVYIGSTDNYGNDAVPIVSDLKDIPNWTHYIFTLDSTYAGTRRISFNWRNFGTGFDLEGSNPPAAIDNLVVNGVRCSKPHSMAETGITYQAATLSWQTGDIGVPAYYTVAYKKSTDSVFSEVTVTDTVCSLTGLSHNSRYMWKVRANCTGDENSEWTMARDFSTECAPITMIPYYEDFENYFETDYTNEIVRPRCWYFSDTTWAYPVIFFPGTAGQQGNQDYIGNSQSLMFGTESHYSDVLAVMPSLDVELHDIRIKFDILAIPNSSANLEIGVVNDDNPSDESVFVLIHTINVVNYPNDWMGVVVDFDSTGLSGRGKHIAFRYQSYDPNDYIWMDNIEISHVDSDSVGIMSVDNRIKLYPNPTHDKIHIVNAQGIVHYVSLFDLLGNQLKLTRVGDSQICVDLSGYTPGVYFIRIVSDDGITTLKVVKQ